MNIELAPIILRLAHRVLALDALSRKSQSKMAISMILRKKAEGNRPSGIKIHHKNIATNGHPEICLDHLYSSGLRSNKIAFYENTPTKALP